VEHPPARPATALDGVTHIGVGTEIGAGEFSRRTTGVALQRAGQIVHTVTKPRTRQQADEAPMLASEIVQARKDAEGATTAPSPIQAAKAATTMAALEQRHAEANDRVTHANLTEVIGSC
jgi:hypothetical protein